MMTPLIRSIRHKATALLALAALFLPLPVYAQDAPFTLQQLLAGMAEVATVRQHFTETKTMALLKSPLTFSGELAYARPDRIEKHTLSPDDEQLTITGDTLTWDNAARHLHRRIDIRSHPEIEAYVAGIRAVLSGDAATLDRFYRPVLTGDRQRWQLTLTPIDTSGRQPLKDICFHGSGNRIARFAVDSANGDHDVTRLDRGTPE